MNSDLGTVKPKLQPVRLKDICGSGIKESTSVRKKVEPVKVKELLKAFSSRKNANQSNYIFPARSVEIIPNVPMTSTTVHNLQGKNVRRKLYPSQNSPSDTPRMFPITEKEETNQVDIAKIQKSRKSCLPPPNSIKDSHVRKTLNKPVITEISYKNAATQTSTTVSVGTCTEQFLNSVEKIDSRNEKVLSQQNIRNENSDTTSSRCNFRNDIGNIINVVSLNEDCKYVQSQYSGATVESAGFFNPLYAHHTQNPLTNPIIVQFPQDIQITRIAELAPIVQERSQLMLIETYLKDVIVKSTQALTLVQNILNGDSSNLQPDSTTARSEKETNLCNPCTPTKSTAEAPHSSFVNLREIKTELILDDTSSPDIKLAVTPDNESSDSGKEENTEPEQLKNLQICLEKCSLITSNSDKPETSKGVTETTTGAIETVNSKVENAVLSEVSASNEINTLEKLKSLLKTKSISRMTGFDFLETPKVKNSVVMTPSRRANKENVQTPLSRRKSFAGIDSQKLRRSARIAKNHLRQSLGDDSFLALERELNIFHPPNIH